MKQLALNMAGLLAGLVGGFLLVPQPLLARFAPAHVTWDGSGCQAGAYTVTSTASNLSTGESFQTTSTNVRLPLLSVGQDFSDLPPGTYRITARSTNSAGEVFQSNAQTVTIGVSPTLPSAPSPTPPSDGGRQRPSSSPTEGTAQPRSPSSTSTSQGGIGGRTGEPVASRSTSAATGGTDTVNSGPRATARLQTAVSVAWVLEALDRLGTVAHGGASLVRDIALVDEDGDGTVDYVRAVVGGRVVTWRIVPRSK